MCHVSMHEHLSFELDMGEETPVPGEQHGLWDLAHCCQYLFGMQAMSVAKHVYSEI